jgi:hypothetical protein
MCLSEIAESPALIVLSERFLLNSGSHNRYHRELKGNRILKQRALLVKGWVINRDFIFSGEDATRIPFFFFNSFGVCVVSLSTKLSVFISLSFFGSFQMK